MLDKIKLIIKDLEKDIKVVKDLEELKQVKAKYLSKSVFYNELKNLIKTVKNKQEVGKWIQSYAQGINKILIDKKNELENSFFIEKIDNPIHTKDRLKLVEKKGAVHPLTEITKEVIQFFDNLNYHYSHSVELEIEKYNFDILNLGKNHPSREMQDTFYLKGGKLLRSQATNMTARELVNLDVNTKTFSSYSVGPVFRNDTNDATHSFQFNQVDIFNIGNDMNISNLKWTLNELMKNLFGKSLLTRYRPSYFPFTEPSYEVDLECPNCASSEKRCNICSQTGWIEILGSGMLAPSVIKNAGKDINVFQGWAAGIGIERVAMIKWNINDIRNFYTNDLDFLASYNKGSEE